MAIAEHETAAQLQAASLWQFVHLKSPLFPHTAALDVVKKLAPAPDEDLKGLAKRLRKELEAYRVKLSHTAALDAAAKLAGFNGWFDASSRLAREPRLAAIRPLNGELTTASISDWTEARKLLCEVADEHHRATGANLFGIKVAKRYFILSAPVRAAADDGPRVQEDALLVLSPSSTDDSTWLEGAEQAIESLRRRFEETGKAIVDGIAVTAFCDKLDEAINSELVVLQADHELEPGFEVARGDEVECWAQIEHLTESDGRDAKLEPETGAWLFGHRRFTFDLATLRPNEFIPGLQIKALNEQESSKLFRRYRLLKQQALGPLPVRSSAKQFEVLGAPVKEYRVDLHRLLLEMKKCGLTWESFCAEMGISEELQPMMQLGILLPILERLKLADPNVVFARPNRAELGKATDLKLLRTLIPRAAHVRFRTNKGLSPEQKAALNEALEELSASIVSRQLTAAPGVFTENPQISHMAYAYDADELVASLEANDLQAYVGVMPYLKATDALSSIPNSSPYAFGLSLYLDIDVAGGAA